MEIYVAHILLSSIWTLVELCIDVKSKTYKQSNKSYENFLQKREKNIYNFYFSFAEEIV